MANARATGRVMCHVIGGVLVIGAASFGAAYSAHAGDFSLDPTSPEVPFTFGQGDVVMQDGSAVSIGAPLLGLDIADNVDAISFGDDQPEPAGLENLVNFDFSVDRASVGNGGTVTSQANTNGAAGDEFRIISFKNGRTVGPQRLMDAPDRGLTVKSSGTNESDIDALSLVAGTQEPVFFSVDRAGSSTLPTVGPADIMYVEDPGVTAPIVYATGAQLGLTSGDNIDALCVMDRGDRGRLDQRDLVYVSLDRSSPTRATALLGGSDAVVRVWPQPAVVIYDRVQLDLAPGDEMNAMTARDPDPDGCPPGSRLDPPTCIDGGSAPSRYAWPSSVAGWRSGRQRDRLRGFQDTADGVTIWRLIEKIRQGNRKVLVPSLVIGSKADNGFGFTAVPGCGERVTSASWRTRFRSLTGVRPGVTNAGCEFDLDTTPGEIPTRFLYTGCTPRPGGGLRAFFNDSGQNQGAVLEFPDADELEFFMTVGDDRGLDVACREPGGNWTTITTVHSYPAFETVTVGFGAAWLDAGAEVQFSNFSVACDGGVAPYLQFLDGCGRRIASADQALDPSFGGGASPDVFSALEEVTGCGVILQGTPGEGPPAKKPATYADGLIELVRASDLGPLPDFASEKAVSNKLGKALRSVLKAQKLLSKSRPNAKGARKQLRRAQSSLDTARNLLVYGVKKVK